MRQKLHFFELNPSDLVANVTRELATDPQHVPLGLAASRGPTIPDPLSQIASSEIGIPGTELRFAIQGTDLGQRAPNASIDIGSSSGVFATRNSESQDWAMALSIVNTVAVITFVCMVRLASRHSRHLLRQVFAPMAPWPSGAFGFPGRWGVFEEVRHVLRQIEEPHLAVGLEGCMMMRYIWHNLRLLSYAVVICGLLVPTYAKLPASPTWWIRERATCPPNASTIPNDKLPDGCVGHWSVVESITVSHVPEGSARLTWCGVACGPTRRATR